MSLLITQDRPGAQKYNLLYFIADDQLFKLTAHDMKSALVKQVLENHPYPISHPLHVLHL